MNKLKINRTEDLQGVIKKARRKFGKAKGFAFAEWPDGSLRLVVQKEMDKRGSKQAKERVSRLMSGRIPWNKNLGTDDPRVRRGIETRKANKALRELIGLIYAKEEL